ncbi:beta-1,6-N-acetylglucosaminyltransferase [Acidocella sp.]|uniref:beta-1,6-N-acetylglucosaminyltransferase n=1 Tax=Acidocella sp. TaxID=50710 RepID=UPI0026112731|nr:beta-1,6-N-acetylglucosaminyltransferase [Acidocella sp.]
MADGNDIAVLILAHTSPGGLAGLARFFAGAGCDLFVHVDAKADEAWFRDAARPWPVRFITPRINVFWRGFTMIDAMISLIQTAHGQKPYARYVILSDDTLPLQPPDVIRNKLSGPEEFITTREAEDFRFRYESFFLFDSVATQIRWIPLRERAVTPDLIARMKRLEALMNRGKKKLERFWYGSQWMALTAAAMDKILRSWEDDAWLRDSFEFSEAPDESYFQTIIGESLGPVNRPLTYVDWNAPEPPRVFAELAEIEALNRPEFMFLRKARLPAAQLDQWITRLRAP